MRAAFKAADSPRRKERFARDEILTARACQLQIITEVIFGRWYIMQS
jgi:hypothetical protein